MKRKRHKWKLSSGNETLFEATYKVEECIICGLLKLHKYGSRRHYLSYVKDGKEFKQLTECTDIKPQNLWQQK
jgi:hypothetical protein